MTLQVALEALRSDAARWERVAQVTHNASAGAQTLGLSPVQLSWASLETGLSNTYDSLLDKTVRLLDEATDVYRDLGITLERVAYAYETNDDNAARDLRGVWDIRE
ncbi:hypothetical protein [Actinoplanes awajinensis]|uniref:PE domain-containing protein n=1 Tax=Actinoplanes awajinensis subsp. mycoplanecinus TaxID=135947 RepID=A0A101JFE0_9ACTN|nr:hypothetical protein [Actinoplanes awajinensis]KUL25848.1 hypothetical protein ADL15_39780 [Actinoplanes awajinensis subsp. mycoplanecinus]